MIGSHLSPWARERARDQVVEAPVVVVDAGDRRVRARRPPTARRCGRSSRRSPASALSWASICARGERAVVEQAVDVDAELLACGRGRGRPRRLRPVAVLRAGAVVAVVRCSRRRGGGRSSRCSSSTRPGSRPRATTRPRRRRPRAPSARDHRSARRDAELTVRACASAAQLAALARARTARARA